MNLAKRATRIHSLALLLEQAAALALTLLAVGFALERIEPLLRLPWLVVTNVEVLVLLTLGLWLSARLIARCWPRTPKPLILPALAWFIVLSVSALAAPSHRNQAVKFVGRMGAALLIGWAAYDLGQIPARWRLWTRAIAVGGLTVALFGLAEMLDLPPFVRFLDHFKEGHTVVGETVRLSATLSYATIASMVLELTLPLLLAWVLTAKEGRTRALLAIGGVAVLAAQVLTLTRGGTIALIAALGGVGIWALWYHHGSWLLASLVAGTMLLLLSGLLLLANPVARLRLHSENEQFWYQAAYKAPAEIVASAGEVVRVPVTLRNQGNRTWTTGGSTPFYLGYHLLRPDGRQVTFNGRATHLPRDVPPGEPLEIEAVLEMPNLAGVYVVEWDMVHETVTWFSWRGNTPARTRLSVTGTADPKTALPKATPAPTVPPPAEEGGRLWLWRTAGQMTLERPLLGVGPDNFRWAHIDWAGLDRGDTRIHANNLYLEWAVNTGLLGLGTFIWLNWQIGRVVYSQLVRKRQGKAERVIWQVALAGSLIAWFVHGIFDTFYAFTPTYVAFALIAGLALVEAPQKEEEPCASATT